MFEVRLANLEKFAHDTTDRLARIETSVDGIKSSGATKAGVEKGLHDLTWKLFGVCALLVGAVYWIVTHSSKEVVMDTKPSSQHMVPSAPAAPAKVPARPAE